MYIRPTSSDMSFGYKVRYSYGCWLDERIKHYKNKTVLYRKDFVDNKLCTLLVYTTDKLGKFIKSELRVFKNDKCVKKIKGQKIDRMV